MIEFSLVFVILLMGIFGAVSAALWTVESMAAVSAGQGIARIAAEGQKTDANLPNGMSAAAMTAALNASGSPWGVLKSSLFGTSLQLTVGGCPSVAAAKSAIQGMAGQVKVCVEARDPVGGGACGPTGAAVPTVPPCQIRVLTYGCASTLVPKFGLEGCPDGAPILVFSAVEASTFTT